MGKHLSHLKNYGQKYRNIDQYYPGSEVGIWNPQEDKNLTYYTRHQVSFRQTIFKSKLLELNIRSCNCNDSEQGGQKYQNPIYTPID